ncbi:MAG: hypothetical protein EXS08_06245 [Planctomycetes bacterium]|nr:hypothetical protein [Planctomycetota bacterium]
MTHTTSASSSAPVADSRERAGVLLCVALAFLLPALAHLGFGARHLNVSDEGFLWYGVRATVAGEVPLRDFQAYHPGRYHWCAAFAPLFGTGILGVRAACAVFEGLGLLCALLVTRRFARGLGWPLLFALLFAACAFPRHKLFESALASMAAWFAVRLLERPTFARHLAAGVFVGLAGYFGSNLGLYAGLGTAAVIALVAWKQREPGRLRRAGAWAGGVVLGFAPFLAMLAFVPGFAGGLRDSIALILEHGANIAKPWPWPWRVASASALPLRDWTESLAFLLPVLFLPPLLVAALRTRAEDLRARAACLAPALLAPFFLHHAAVNSGAWHLAQCVQPLLLALLGLPLFFDARATLVRSLAWGATTALFGTFALAWNPLLDASGERFVTSDVGGESLELPAGQARYFAGIQQTVEKRVGAERLFLAPNMPALYCAFDKSSPSWWIYFFFPASEQEQQELIAALAAQHVDWALIGDPPPGTSVEKSFRTTHPLVWQHFENDWRRVSAPLLPGDLALFRRK